MKLTRTQKRILIETHPDRHGGDHSRLGRFFAALRRPSQAMNAIRRCIVCGVRIGGLRTCQVHRYARRAIAGLVLLLAVSSRAGSVNLAWDASATSGVTNYLLYASTNALTATNLASAPVKVACGTNLNVTITGLAAPLTWQFAVTAVKGGVQSDPSNVVIAQVPLTPANARVVAVQYLELDTTNATDVGFFRLRIGQ